MASEERGNGVTWIGHPGPELINLPKGATIQLKADCFAASNKSPVNVDVTQCLEDIEQLIGKLKELRR